MEDHDADAFSDSGLETSLRDRVQYYETHPHVVTSSVSLEDIKEYNERQETLLALIGETKKTLTLEREKSKALQDAIESMKEKHEERLGKAQSLLQEKDEAIETLEEDVTSKREVIERLLQSNRDLSERGASKTEAAKGCSQCLLYQVTIEDLKKKIGELTVTMEINWHEHSTTIKNLEGRVTVLSKDCEIKDRELEFYKEKEQLNVQISEEVSLKEEKLVCEVETLKRSLSEVQIEKQLQKELLQREIEAMREEYQGYRRAKEEELLSEQLKNQRVSASLDSVMTDIEALIQTRVFEQREEIQREYKAALQHKEDILQQSQNKITQLQSKISFSQNLLLQKQKENDHLFNSLESSQVLILELESKLARLKADAPNAAGDPPLPLNESMGGEEVATDENQIDLREGVALPTLGGTSELDELVEASEGLVLGGKEVILPIDEESAQVEVNDSHLIAPSDGSQTGSTHGNEEKNNRNKDTSRSSEDARKCPAVSLVIGEEESDNEEPQATIGNTRTRKSSAYSRRSRFDEKNLSTIEKRDGDEWHRIHQELLQKIQKLRARLRKVSSYATETSHLVETLTYALETIQREVEFEREHCTLVPTVEYNIVINYLSLQRGRQFDSPQVTETLLWNGAGHAVQSLQSEDSEVNSPSEKRLTLMKTADSRVLGERDESLKLQDARATRSRASSMGVTEGLENIRRRSSSSVYFLEERQRLRESKKGALDRINNAFDMANARSSDDSTKFNASVKFSLENPAYEGEDDKRSEKDETNDSQKEKKRNPEEGRKISEKKRKKETHSPISIISAAGDGKGKKYSSSLYEISQWRKRWRFKTMSLLAQSEADAAHKKKIEKINNLCDSITLSLSSGSSLVL